MEETYKLITSINPIYYAISPISMLFRGIHCLPILVKPKPKNIGEFNKYAESSLPCDVTFHKDEYISFQFLQYKFKNQEFMTTLPTKLDTWSQKHFFCDANIETSNESIADFVINIVKIKPSERIGNKTHLFVMFPSIKGLVCLLDHYYCDGIILFDVFKHLFPEITINLPFPKYMYYPLLSDAFAVEYVTRNLYDFYKKPTLITQHGDKTHLISRIILKKKSSYWNRWSNYALNLLTVFECTTGLEYARVALSVGIDTDFTFGNNRIGCIIVFIEKPPEQLSRKSKIKHLMRQFESKVTLNYKDCITSYDIVRSYDTTSLRRLATTTGIDIFFTSMFVPIKIDVIQSGIGAFIGNEYNYSLFYINSMTLDDASYTTFTTNWSEFNHKKYISEFDAKLIYTFD